MQWQLLQAVCGQLVLLEPKSEHSQEETLCPLAVSLSEVIAGWG